MKIFATYEKVVKEIILPEGKETIPELRKMVCEVFSVEPDQIVLRSGTRAVKDTFQLKPESNINVGKVKPAESEESEGEEEYEYAYEEVTDQDEDYAAESDASSSDGSESDGK